MSFSGIQSGFGLVCLTEQVFSHIYLWKSSRFANTCGVWCSARTYALLIHLWNSDEFASVFALNTMLLLYMFPCPMKCGLYASQWDCAYIFFFCVVSFLLLLIYDRQQGFNRECILKDRIYLALCAFTYSKHVSS